MDVIKLKAYAKINLFLDVINKKDNGYHEMQMVMEQLELHDTITIEKTQDLIIEVICDKNICSEVDNIVFKAAKLMYKTYDINYGVKITVTKNIFVAAGLAGGSSDAAVTIIGINKMFRLGLTQQEMLKIGLKLGADVPYCIYGHTALAKGIGEELKRLPKHEPCTILLAKPSIGISTKKVFDNLSVSDYSFNNKYNHNLQNIINGLEQKDKNLIAHNLHNTLQDVTIKILPEIYDIINIMTSNNAINAMMSGSGPTVFGYYNDEHTANIDLKILTNKYKDIEVAVTKIRE